MCFTDLPEITEDGPDYARGGGGLESSSDDEEDDDAEEEEQGILDHHWNEPDHDAPEAADITHRLALCNMDWDRIKARDLYVLFNSFVPKGGALQSITIYPSQIGLEKMAEEEKMGPQEFREGEEATNDDGNMGELNRARLRQYQLNRLKYYFGVIVCDSKETANKIYEECDSTEYEKSACRIDLRFIPDDMTFDETPKETCAGISDLTSFQPSTFTTTAFCQASVQVTWDETNIDRLKKTMKKFTEEDVENDQFDELIASSEEEGTDDAENDDAEKVGEKSKKKKKKKSEKKRMKKYRKLLGLDADKKSKRKKKAKPQILEEVGEEESDEEMQLTVAHSINGKKKEKKAMKTNVKKKAQNDSSSEDEEGEGGKEGGMQFTWEPSVDQQKQRKKGKEKLTPWEEYQQKKKGKKREKRRERKKEKLRQQGVEDTTNLGFDDPFFNDESDEDRKKKKKKERRKKKGEEVNEAEDEADKKEKASLGLLMNDDDDRHSHFSLLQIMKEENEGRKKKGKKRKQSETVDADTFEISLDQSRFAGLYTDPQMHIDPNAPEFKKTKGMMALMEEVSKKRKTVHDAR